jgi:AAA domain, putative AbiEii toxin, Type IV TA system
MPSWFLSAEQVGQSLKSLAKVHPFFGISFLAFKRIGLPVGRTTFVVFAQAADAILDQYYRVDTSFAGFYSPFKTSKASERWVAPRYGSTSLQRITADTFGDAFLHPKKSSEWGWREDYVEILRRHQDDEGHRIPMVDLAVWLYRRREFARPPDPESLIALFLEDFQITPVEMEALFEEPASRTIGSARAPVTDEDLLDMTDPSPTAKPVGNAALDFIRLEQCGPAAAFLYEPGERLTLITGDNSLGKTFLLDAVWWALTWEWADQPLQPRTDAPSGGPLIAFGVSAGRRRQEFTALYDWAAQRWATPRKRNLFPGVAVYARFDGSFAVWDPATLTRRAPGERNTVNFKNDEIWNGLKDQDRNRVLSNGLLADWINWERGGDAQRKSYLDLMSCLELLSPSLGESLQPGRPRKMAFDAREIPTLAMPYGDIPVLFASAGVKRMLALAYMMVWAWNEHLANSSLTRQEPSEKLILLVDEVEAHLHPHWQRRIVPSLMKAVSRLVVSFEPQVHVVTHSPMVLASAETFWNPDLDKLHHLRLEGQEVVLEELPFDKEGRIDRWLTSPVFGLAAPRSEVAEKTIAAANAMQRGELDATPEAKEKVHADLLRVLAQDDSYWPRWWAFFHERT